MTYLSDDENTTNTIKFLKDSGTYKITTEQGTFGSCSNYVKFSHGNNPPTNNVRAQIRSFIVDGQEILPLIIERI